MGQASRGAPESVVVTGTKAMPTSVSTVPGEGRVKEDTMARGAYDRSAAAYTGPQKEHFGG